MTGLGARRAAALALASLALLCLWPGVAAAQSNDLRSLLTRLERLEGSVNLLNRQVFAGRAPAQPPEPPAGGAVADLEVRLQRLEDGLRELTGAVEQASFAQRQLAERLAALEGAGRAAPGTPGATGPVPPGSGPGLSWSGPGGTTGAVVPGDGGTGGPSAGPPTRLGPGGEPAVIGSLPVGPGTPNPTTPDAAYARAYGLLEVAQYAEAETAFSAFLAAHGDTPLAEKARYWLGETYFAREDYERAAIAFAEAYQAAPEGSRAPESLLRLGQALARRGQQEEACVSFTSLLERYPTAPETTRRRAEGERERLGC